MSYMHMHTCTCTCTCCYVVKRLSKPVGQVRRFRPNSRSNLSIRTTHFSVSLNKHTRPVWVVTCACTCSDCWRRTKRSPPPEDDQTRRAAAHSRGAAAGTRVQPLSLSLAADHGMRWTLRLFAVSQSCRLSTATWTRNGSPGLELRGFNKVAPLAPASSEGPRDMVVVCHVPELVARGSGIQLNNLPKGRVDVLARCASSAIFLSHGVRENTRIWLQLQEHDIALCLDGGAVRGEAPHARHTTPRPAPTPGPARHARRHAP